jgi:hypothetical protein
MDPRSSRFAVLILDSEERPKAAAAARKRAGGKGRARERAGYVVAFEAQSPTPLVAWRLQKVRLRYDNAAREDSHDERDCQVAVIWLFWQCKVSAMSIWSLCSVPSPSCLFMEANERFCSGLSCRVAVYARLSKKRLQFDYISRLLFALSAPWLSRASGLRPAA